MQSLSVFVSRHVSCFTDQAHSRKSRPIVSLCHRQNLSSSAVPYGSVLDVGMYHQAVLREPFW
jgi:hypothetical protein